MKKKLVLLLVCVVMSLCLLLTACNSDPNKILDQVSAQSASASKITAETTVKDSSDMVIGKETAVYEIKTGKKTVTKNVPNTDFSKENVWVETTNTVDFKSSDVKFAWKEDSFSSLALDGLVLTGTIGNQSVGSSLGIESADVKGDVTVVITASGSLDADLKVTNITLSYVSANNNNVTVVITMA